MPTAVITGAAQGIGRQAAELLGARGYQIAIIDRQSATATVSAIKAAGGNARSVIADITDEPAIEFFVQSILQQFGHVEVLVNNAGISHIEPAEKTSAASFRRVIEVNLLAPFLLSKAFGAEMLAAGVGSIINVASIAGLFGISDRAAYNASKHGLVGLTRTLAGEWGGRGVRVNAVCPGWVKTEMDQADQAGGTYSDEDIVARVPMGRFANPADIAHAIAFLADPTESGFINGQTLIVDGGWTADASWESLRLAKR